MPRPRSVTLATEKNRNDETLPGGRVINDAPQDVQEEQELVKTNGVDQLDRASDKKSKI
jgi:hypothetical protein